MNTKQLQTWLRKYGYYKGEIDGIFGSQTRKALNDAQGYLKKINLYAGEIDGKYGDLTKSAIDAWEKGYRYYNKYGVKFNIHSQDSVARAVDWLRKKGIKQVRFNDRTINLGDRSAYDLFAQGAKDAIAGKSSAVTGNVNSSLFEKVRTAVGNAANKVSSTVGSAIDGIRATGSHVRATDGGDSSYDVGDLDNLVMRYAYDKYHGTKVNDKDWGISYSGNPHGAGLTLFIDDSRYNPEQAEQIARGAGLASYMYGNKRYDMNLFRGGKYKDRKAFDKAIDTLVDSRSYDEAQRLYNEELKRQYDTYGIDFNMLRNKSQGQWNNLFGVVPYGYSGESIGTILSGEQAVQAGDSSRTKNRGIGAENVTYRWTGKDGDKGRFQYGNFDEWYKARMLATPEYGHNGGISATRPSRPLTPWESRSRKA